MSKIELKLKPIFEETTMTVELTDLGFTKEEYVIGDSCRSNGFSLRFHIFGDAVG